MQLAWINRLRPVFFLIKWKFYNPSPSPPNPVQSPLHSKFLFKIHIQSRSKKKNNKKIKIEIIH